MNSNLMEYRERKFSKHKIEVREEKATEERTRKVLRLNPKTEKMEEMKEMYLMDFSHAVYRGTVLVGRTQSRRSALKLAHQHIRNTR